METLTQRLSDLWLTNGVELRPGVSEQAIEQFEKRHGVLLPLDLRDYFLTLDGTGQNQMDDGMLAWWSLDEVTPLADVEKSVELEHSQQYFVFADFLISSHHYAIGLFPERAEKNPVVSTSDHPIPVIADSFSDFLRKHLEHSGDYPFDLV